MLLKVHKLPRIPFETYPRALEAYNEMEAYTSTLALSNPLSPRPHNAIKSHLKLIPGFYGHVYMFPNLGGGAVCISVLTCPLFGVWVARSKSYFILRN